MSKPLRKPALPPSFNPSVFEQPTTGTLLNTETVNQMAAIATGQTLPEKPEATKAATEPLKKSYGRPIKESAIGRDRFTTRLRPEYVEDLKRLAARRRITVADLVEEIISNYVDSNRI